MPRRPRANSLNRLGVLERKRHQKRRSGPVAMFPKLISIDDFEFISVQQQRRLKVNAMEGTAVDYSGIPEIELEASG